MHLKIPPSIVCRAVAAMSGTGSGEAAAPARFVLGFALLIGLAGCVASTEVKINSMAKPKAEDAIAYQIRNTSHGVDSTSLRYEEVARFVRTALSGKGMYEAPPGTPVDLVVDLDYGISPPQGRSKIEQQPIFTNVPGESTPVSRTVGVDSNGTSINQTIYVQGPSTLQVTGYRDVVVAVVVYEKYLRLTGRENKAAEEGKPGTELWAVDVISEGENRELRKVLPILVAASIPYIGKDSHGEKTIRIKDTDKAIDFVKKGMGEPNAPTTSKPPAS